MGVWNLRSVIDLIKRQIIISNENDVIQQMKDAGLHKKCHNKGYFYTDAQIQKMRQDAVLAGYNRGFDDCLKQESDTATKIFSINVPKR